MVYSVDMPLITTLVMTVFLCLSNVHDSRSFVEYTSGKSGNSDNTYKNVRYRDLFAVSRYFEYKQTSSELREKCCMF